MELKPRPLERGVGIAILLAFLILVIGIVVSTQGRKFFRGYKDAVFYMENGQGIRHGTPVTVNGLPAGTVQSVEPEVRTVLEEVEGATKQKEVDHVKVTVRIYSPFDNYLREGSQVKVNLPFIMGSTTIDIVPGPVNNPPLPSGGLLEEELVKGLGGKVENFIDTGNSVLEHFEEISDKLKDAVANVEGITHRINYGKNTLGELLNDDRKMYNQILTLLTDADSAANNLDRLAVDLKKITTDLPEVVRDLRETAATLRQTSENALEISQDMGTLPTDLDAMIVEVGGSVRKLDTFTDDLVPLGKELKQFSRDDMPTLTKLISDTADAAVLLEVASRDLPGVMQQTKDTLKKTEAISSSLKGTWPISGNLPPDRYLPRTVLLPARASALDAPPESDDNPASKPPSKRKEDDGP